MKSDEIRLPEMTIETIKRNLGEGETLKDWVMDAILTKILSLP